MKHSHVEEKKKPKLGRYSRSRSRSPSLERKRHKQVREQSSHEGGRNLQETRSENDEEQVRNRRARPSRWANEEPAGRPKSPEGHDDRRSNSRRREEDSRQSRNRSPHRERHHERSRTHDNIHIKEEPRDNDRRRNRDGDDRRYERSRWDDDDAREGNRGGNRRGDNRRAEEGASNSFGDGASNAPAPDKSKPNFGLSGKLTEDTNTYNGVVIKYNEPPEARKPRKKWRIYRFKGDQDLPMLPIHRQSAFLLGRDRKVADVPIDHPSCSKQHAVIQFRLINYERDDGTTGRQVKPYIIDLDSANGTFVNKNKVDPRRYVELFEKDVLNFGFSSRDYVLLHEGSKDDEEEFDAGVD